MFFDKIFLSIFCITCTCMHVSRTHDFSQSDPSEKTCVCALICIKAMCTDTVKSDDPDQCMNYIHLLVEVI